MLDFIAENLLAHIPTHHNSSYLMTSNITIASVLGKSSSSIIEVWALANGHGNHMRKIVGPITHSSSSLVTSVIRENNKKLVLACKCFFEPIARVQINGDCV